MACLYNELLLGYYCLMIAYVVIPPKYGCELFLDLTGLSLTKADLNP